MAGTPKIPHNSDLLGQAVAIALAAARQLGHDVVVQRSVQDGLGYPVSLDGRLPKNRSKSNCYRVTPKGEIIAYPGNAPYVEPASELERVKMSKQEFAAREAWLREREAAIRAAERQLGLVPRDLARIADIMCKEGEIGRGVSVLEGPCGSFYPVFVSLISEGKDVSARVLMVGRSSDKEKALKTANAWLGKTEE